VREFAVKPYWDGGAHPPPADRNSIHHKGLISYDGVPKPAWGIARAAFHATPLYRDDATSTTHIKLAESSSGAGEIGLVFGVLLLILGVLAFDLWCVRGIWRALQAEPPRRTAEVITLRRVA
jgi:beta-glucuronidase